MGVINVERDVSEEEILTDAENRLPDYIKLNYIRMKVDTFKIPVKQCYRCFAYGHVATQGNVVRLEVRACALRTRTANYAERDYSWRNLAVLVQP
ncbi:hypothetical protein J6590_087262 [Homalodisca vitripennis]|nr:hypothetical protein J6590_087262 [Homalodisca vitripennis]